MSSVVSAHVSRKLSNCKNVRRAGDLKSQDESSTKKGGRREIKVREAGEQGTGGGRGESGGSDPLSSPPPPLTKYCACLHGRYGLKAIAVVLILKGTFFIAIVAH